MKYFLKLNMVSILYALMIFVPIQLMGNVYRVSRLTGWNIGTVNTLSGVAIVVGFISLQKVDERSRIQLDSYPLDSIFCSFYIYNRISIPNKIWRDVHNPVTGLFVIVGLMVFPFYILALLNFNVDYCII